MERVTVNFRLNGRPVRLQVRPWATLLQALRDDLGAMEVKYGCGEGVCGTCTVLLDGESVNACLLLAAQVEGCDVMTVSGLIPEGGGLHPLQEAFVRHGAAQCGFCTPGMVLTAYEFVRQHPRASRAQIRQALSGNLCRCTGYTKIVDAVEDYVRVCAGGGSSR